MYEEYSKRLQRYKGHFEKYHWKTYPSIIDFNGLPMPFDFNAKNIGINFSGGADSTLLLYVLCKIISENNLPTKIHPIHNIRFYKEKPWLPQMAKNCYNYLKLRFGNILKPVQYGFIPTELELTKISQLDIPHLAYEFTADKASCDVLYTHRYNQFIIDMLDLEWVYSGTTTNPPIEHEKAPGFRDAEITQDKLELVMSASGINPFALITKDWVMAQYKNLDIDDLLELTRSCEADMRVYDIKAWKTGDDYPEPCGTCFFCKEREWGIDNMEKWIL